MSDKSDYKPNTWQARGQEQSSQVYCVEAQETYTNICWNRKQGSLHSADIYRQFHELVV